MSFGEEKHPRAEWDANLNDMNATSELGLVTAVYRTTNAIVRELDRRLGRDHSITFIQAVTLIAIDSFERPQPHLVAEYLSQQSQTVTGVLDRLERAGHVRRFRDLDDRRAVRLELTEQGKRLVEAMGASLQHHVEELFERVDSQTRRRLVADLGCVEQSVQSATPA